MSSSVQQPAPGSDLPGAPPPLKRQLTSEDGHQGPPRPSTDRGAACRAPAATEAPAAAPAATTWYLAALGL
ncbi:hypothetical protein, partial [Pseudonocardia nigra]|uniref:hypothetical protein n=1 Tax=Pseudonocardia nigra TaxID=1921578 RepID=UPI001C5CEFA5